MATSSAESQRREELHERLRGAVRSADHEPWLVLRDEVFAVPCDEGYLVFSPFHGMIFSVNRAGLASILLNEDKGLAACLEDLKVDETSTTVELPDLFARKNPSETTDSADTGPVSLTLSPTSTCQLRCTYCYIHGGDDPQHMPWAIAEDAIRYCLENAVRAGRKHFDLCFHGQGEPTANWPLLRDATCFTKEECERRGMTARFSVGTNGVLSEEQIDFLVRHRFAINLSLDGLRKTSDIQRPLRGKGSSFERVWQTIRHLEAKGADYGIRSTVTEINLGETAEFVTFLGNRTRCRTVKLEPIFMVGRANGQHCTTPEFNRDFVESFRRARHAGDALGVSVGYSACRMGGVTKTFCGAYGPNLTFFVSTQGLVSSCYEVLDESDPRAELFIYGRHDPRRRTFELYPDRVERLRSLDVTKMKRCRDCFAKWNCGGGCLAKTSLEQPDQLTGEQPLERCSIARSLLKDDLIRLSARETSQTEGVNDD